MKKYQNTQENIIIIHDSNFEYNGNKRYDTPQIIREMDDNEKPREKLVKNGPSSLSSHELLAIILSPGTKKEEVLTMSRRIFKEYGEKSIVFETNVKKLKKALDIPTAKACKIVACFELGRRFFHKRKGKQIFIRSARDAAKYLQDMRELEKEHLRGLYLNSRNCLLHDELISIGSLTASIIHPREVFRPALEYSATSIILAHNHPSGISKPSKADIEITKQLVEAGKNLGINLIDHIILSKNKFISIPVEYII